MVPKQLLAQYGAASTQVVYPHDTEQTDAPGGGLEAAVNEHGVAPLAGLLHARTDVSALVLKDDGVTLTLSRNGVGAVLLVEWASGERFEEQVEIAPHPGLDSFDGPTFRPDPASRVHDLGSALRQGVDLYGVDSGAGLRWYRAGAWGQGAGALPLKAWTRGDVELGPTWFRESMGVKANYVAGAMAGGIASAEMVIAMARAGYLAFYGSGGLPMQQVREDVGRIVDAVGDLPVGFNLLHNPVEPEVEQATVDLYIQQGCRFVSASAFMDLTPAIVRYRYHGIHLDENGDTRCPNRVFAKVSRAEVATRFLKPAPRKMLDALVAEGVLSAAQAALASKVPMADAVTAEADSGGHTDRRPLSVLVPLLRDLRDRLAVPGWQVALGAAGGIGTPQSIVSALRLGADYVLTGSVNQCTLEAGTSDVAKEMLLQADMADVASGPAPDMFELGAHVQVLSRGTMYARRGDQLYRIYKDFPSWDEVPAKTRTKVEKQILARPFDEVWADCAAYWGGRDARQVTRAETDGRHKMALVFRWYLGMSSRWARLGDATRKRDFQIWCGPSMGAFNAWVEGTGLEPMGARDVVTVADALLDGAAALTRAHRLAAQGVDLPERVWAARPA